jgi:tyrosyl-tRNA synthetase
VKKGGNTGYDISRPLNRVRDFFIIKSGSFRMEEKMQVYEELVARGLIAQVTNEEEIRDMVNNGKATFYIGFDPTADSLHVGHFMALCLMKRLQMAGNKPIALVGGGTAMIGDPSGRTDLRQMMTPETIQHNVDCFKKQMSRFIDFSEGKAILVNNADWLMDLNYIEVLRDVGAHFSVNRMLSAECYKQRMEKGLSFLEFNYMIMQSYDFYKLFQDYGCNMQFGGDDQWSNMLGGTELIRRKLGKDAHAMTITLLLNSEGKKMGKTAKGAVWLDPEKTSPFEFYQYWRNVDDSDVLKCIRMLTFLPLEEIDAMSDWEGAQLNKAKEILAFELTKLVHGEEEALKAQESAKALFSSGNAAEMPTVELTDEDLENGTIGILNLLNKSGMVPSNSEARRAVQQGGVAIDGEKITDIHAQIDGGKLAGDGVVLKKGKKNFRRMVLK